VYPRLGIVYIVQYVVWFSIASIGYWFTFLIWPSDE
jgi:hypothetical protein